jgi:cytochrome c oxidase subunit 3
VTPAVDAQYEDLAHQDRTGRFGMWVFIGSEVLFFGALFALYFGYRAHYPAAFAAASHHAKLVLGTANTYVLLTSSLSVALAVDAVRHDRRRRALFLIALTVALALVFLALKLTEYAAHIEEGILPGRAFHVAALPGPGPMLYFTLYYAMTGLHALHVLVGIGLFSWVFVRVRRGAWSPAGYLGLDLVGLYWHFVDVVWLFLWPMFYLLH